MGTASCRAVDELTPSQGRAASEVRLHVDRSFSCLAPFVSESTQATMHDAKTRDGAMPGPMPSAHRRRPGRGLS